MVVRRSPGDSQWGQKFLRVPGSLGKPDGVWRDMGDSEGCGSVFRKSGDGRERGVCSEKYRRLGVGERGFSRRAWEAQRPGRPGGAGTAQGILKVRMGHS